MSDPEPQRRVDPEHPWPALLSFGEDDQQYFGGRKEEVEALYRRIVSSRLTLLFGLSGLGKTSLLRAGLFPRLRGEHYFPVYIRLRFGRDLPTPVEQIKAEIKAQARAGGIEAPELREGETLWQYFHRADADFWDERNYPCIPVLVFDQFEELFTKSRDVPEQAEEMIEELADLTEGASPALMRAAAERDPSLLRQVFGDRYRLLIGIRSDYLAQLQAISDRVRAVFSNRYELHRMSGAAALESTLTAGGHLLDDDVARRIVRFVAGVPEGDGSVDDLEVEPALLSLVCSELNATRLENHEPKITASMLSGTKDEILSRFYEASFADVAPELRELVEDKLVTRDGKGRNFISEQTARETPGVTEEDLARLVHRRLLRFEESGSSRRMELTHDLLTIVAAASRATREQRRQLEEAQRARAEAEQREASTRRALRRSRAAMLLFFVLLAAAVAGPFIAARWTATGARRVEADSAFRLALQKLSSDEPGEGLAYLARVIRLDRGHNAARTLLYQQLVTRSWPVTIRSFGPEGRINDAVFNKAGTRVALRLGDAVEMWDVARGERIGSIDIGFVPESMELASDGWTVLFDRGAHYGAKNQRPPLWDPRAGRLTFNNLRQRLGGRGCGNFQVFDVSPTGEDLAVGCNGLIIVPLGGGRPIETLLPVYSGFRSSRFAPDPRYLVVDEDTILDRQRPGGLVLRQLNPGESIAGFSASAGRLAIVNRAHEVEAWDFVAWQSAGRKFDNHAVPRSIIFDATGGIIMTTAEDDGIRLWNAGTGQLLFDPLWHDDVEVAGFSSDAARIMTASDRLARWWSAHDGTQLGSPVVRPKMPAAHLDGRGNIVTVSGKARVWELAAAIPSPVLTEDVRVIGLSADRKTALANYMDAGFDTATGEARWKRSDESSVLAIDPPFSRVFVLRDDGLSLVDLETPKTVWTVPQQEVGYARFSADGTVLVFDATTAAPESKRILNVVSAANGTPLVPPIHLPGVWVVRDVTRDGSLLAIQFESTMRIWHVRRQRAALEFPAADGIRVAFSDDGRKLAAVSSHEGLRVWDIATGKGQTVKQTGEKLIAPAFSPDGRHLAATSENGVVLCDATTLDCADEVLAHAGVSRLEFSADGKRILTVTSGDVRVWDTATKQPLSLPLSRDEDTPVGLSPDGMSVFAIMNRELFRIALPSIVDDADAERLATLGEALAGVRLDHLGVTEPVDAVDALSGLGKDCRDVESPACRIVRWLRTPPAKRTVSPVSDVTIADYVKRKAQDASPNEWWRLKALFPHEPALGTEPPE